MIPQRHGIEEETSPPFELVYLFDDAKAGRTVLFRAAAQQIEIRVTPTGRLRVSCPRKAGSLRAKGFEVKG